MHLNVSIQYRFDKLIDSSNVFDLCVYHFSAKSSKREQNEKNYNDFYLFNKVRGAIFNIQFKIEFISKQKQK